MKNEKKLPRELSVNETQHVSGSGSAALVAIVLMIAKLAKDQDKKSKKN